ncbi:alpha/beta hydrolase [soil metagenome]
MAETAFIIKTFRHSDGYVACYRHYQTAAHPVGRIVFVHGIRSHGGWYERSCTQLMQAGFEVYFLDRRGAGLNTAHRGDCPSFRRLLDDVGEFLHDLRMSKPWLPITLAGISWGGKLAAGLHYRTPGLVNAVALFCPGFCPIVAPPLVQRIGVAQARFRDPTKLFPVPLNEPDYFTANPEWQRFIDADRFGLRMATGRFLYSSFSFDIFLKRAVKKCTVPTLLMLAGQDKVIDNAKTRKFLVNFGARDRTIIDYADAHHTLEFEPEGHAFVGDMIAWIQKKTTIVSLRRGGFAERSVERLQASRLV